MLSTILLSQTKSRALALLSARLIAKRGRYFHEAASHLMPPPLLTRRMLSSAVPALEDGFMTEEEEEAIQSCFRVTAKYEPTGDQPQAIAKLLEQLRDGDEFSILQGVTGTGKTLVMSHVIAGYGRPTLILCHNKTLAAQLARELRSFLKENSVELFVSYYNHFVPESYVEATGKYIAKKSSINGDIDVLRHRATRALMTRRDVVIVASVSCIYGLGLPKDYLEASLPLEMGESVAWGELADKLESMLYTRNENDHDFERGHYQLSSSLNDNNKERRSITLWAPHDSFPMTIELESLDSSQGMEPSLDMSSSRLFRIESIREGGPDGLLPTDYCRIFPAKHHVTPQDRLLQACEAIQDELKDRVQQLAHEGKPNEAARLHKRVTNDLEMLRETGFCAGGENYSRHLAGRAAGERPDTLMDYLALHGKDWLLMVDESHVTLSQLKAMYQGDRSRKQKLVKHGFRLPSALDNRPLKDSEFWDQIHQAVLVSATPSSQELLLAERDPVEMVIRPTFVCDPVIEVRPTEGQLDDLQREIVKRAQQGQRTLAIALTKRDAEDLASFLLEHGIKSAYIHSDLSTTERADVIQDLQRGNIDCLVGVNLLREGMDLPQVSLVAVLNADANGFLRSETALLQIVGRAARNVNGHAIFYGKSVTDNMRKCMEVSAKRRGIQLAYNRHHGCEMRTTQGSSTLSIFDLLKDQIEAERSLEATGEHAEQQSIVPKRTKSSKHEIETDHIPNSPGVYFWKDETGRILYIGKAARLRSRVKSYLLPSAKHSRRIQTMVSKAASVEFILTPSERDALVLESNLIKHHQCPFNVLLKDDEHYPYICASVGDALPTLTIVPRRHDPDTLTRRYRYFGPYTSFREINRILEGIEDRYNLRSQAFLARHGEGSKEDYQQLFQKVLDEVFGSSASRASESSLAALRTEYEQAGQLFDSKYNKCRDIVALSTIESHDDDDGESEEQDEQSALVLVVQFRDGLVAGRFSYTCRIPFGLETDEDKSAVIKTVLERKHYPSGQESAGGDFSWFPDEVLVSHPIPESDELESVIAKAKSQLGSSSRKRVSVRGAATKGTRKEADARALQFAQDNVEQLSREWADGNSADNNDERLLHPSVDLDGMSELPSLIPMDAVPKRIECYDISHTQGDHAVGSRVVFEDGRPVKALYRKFNIKTVEGIDDYASLQEVLERRFRHAWVNGKGGPVDKDDPWALPDLVVIDGGPGQLGAAIKGMAKSSVFPAGQQQEPRNGERQATVAICALAKDEEEVFVPGRKGPVNESPDSPGLLLLRALRDESHRFALNSHRRRRSVTKT